MTRTELEAMLRSTEKDVVRIELVAGEGKKTSSKVGGTPYWPEGTPYPAGMVFLAQVNFEEVPKTEGLPDTGILQFFIRDDDCYGLFSKEDKCRVIYHETVGTSADIVPRMTRNTPVIAPAGMVFEKDREKMSYSDRLFLGDIKTDDCQEYDGEGSKLLGYPFFTQTDPREEDTVYDTLLFQLDSGDFVMWGDVGVGNFFINKDKLMERDFSDVLYNWDCC